MIIYQSVRLMKKKKSLKPSTLRRKCLQLWSYIIRERAGFKCEFCGSTKFLQAHHIIGKRFRETMFNVTNGICLCAKCHKWGIGYSAHENPIVISEFLKDTRPIAYEYLKSQFHPKFIGTTLKAKEFIRLDYEKELNKLEEYRLEYIVKDKKYLRRYRKIRRASFNRTH